MKRWCCLGLALLGFAACGPVDGEPEKFAVLFSALASPNASPVSPAGYLGNFNLSSAGYRIAFRFVLPATATIDRWYFIVNGEGATCIGGRSGYGHGSGGIWRGRIVPVDAATGLPQSSVIAEETVGACQAYARSKSEFGLSAYHQVHYVQFAPTTLEGGRLYAFVLSNVDANPGSGGGGSTGNHMSPNLNFANLTHMGPHGKNTLSATAPNAMYGLDPRETTLWSADNGNTWRFGDQVGWYENGNGVGRMWPNPGYRIAGGPNVVHGWPYANWPSEGPAAVTFRNVPAAITLTIAGASSSGGNVGAISVKNLSTGQVATTGALGTGVVRGALSSPVAVAVGQSYTVSTSGTVDTGAGSDIDSVFGLGGSSSPVCVTPQSPNCNSATYRPMLYAADEMPAAVVDAGSMAPPDAGLPPTDDAGVDGGDAGRDQADAGSAPPEPPPSGADGGGLSADAGAPATPETPRPADALTGGCGCQSGSDAWAAVALGLATLVSSRRRRPLSPNQSAVSLLRLNGLSPPRRE